MMEELVQTISEMGISFAYDHFAEGESPDPPFLCYLIPGSDNFAADGKVYHKVGQVHIELYNIIAVDHQNNKRKSLKFRCSKVRR